MIHKNLMIIKFKLCILCFLISVSFLHAQPDYSAYHSFLQKYVSESGKVNYKDLKNKETDYLKSLLLLSRQLPKGSWTRADKLSFWLNIYNAYTIKLILEHYPLKTITSINSGKAWSLNFIQIENKKFSLDQIENEIIRKEFKDARIHFALNCAAVSCPPLYNKVFTASQLENQLELRTKSFIQSSSNQLSESKIVISKLFDWYKADFPDLILFLNKYSNKRLNPNASIEYMDYNWNLNE